MRTLTPVEKERLKILTERQIQFTLIEPTQTGLQKSIMDSTASVRLFLKRNGVHDYELQSQGEKSKVLLNSYFVKKDKLIKTKGSLYRPKTKKGDPRIWFWRLGSYSSPYDILAIIVYNKELYVVNVSKIDIKHLINEAPNPLKELVNSIYINENKVANELLSLLETIAAKGWIETKVQADTAVGRTLESELGIDINSSKKPDYKGIELKTYRSNRNNRKSLFAQVPNWNRSKFKSSAQILEHFGYWRNDEFRLYCTVNSIRRNSQSLLLSLNEQKECLFENSNKDEIGDFVLWELEKLHNRLAEKHNETFWIKANSKKVENKEFILYTEIEHTKKPIITQFDILLEQGYITLDHLIKRDSKGRVKEKGPFFKVESSALNLLFPPSQIYNLLE